VDGSRLTIDQLAAKVGMTTRNIRAHQARGLLPPPVLEGRTGYYGALHVERLLQIRRLQDEGMNLATIAKVVEDGSLLQALRDPFTAEAPYEVPRAELEGRLGVEPGSGAAALAVELGVVEEVDDDTLRVRLPSVARRAEELVAMGVPIEAQLQAVATVHRASEEVAGAFLGLAQQHLFVQVALETDGDLAQVRAAVERLRAIAADVVQAMFLQAMADALEAIVEA
jgi:DNA-binding transcriptional MerR regulator